MPITMVTQNAYPTTVLLSISPRMLAKVTGQPRRIYGIGNFSPTVGRFAIAVELSKVNKIAKLQGAKTSETLSAYEPNRAQAGPS